MSGQEPDDGHPGASDWGSLAQGITHETSFSLLLLGAVICASMVAQFVWPSYGRQVITIERVTGPLPWFVTAMGLTVAFVVLWLTLRRHARNEGRSAAGFAVAALIGMILTLTPFTALLGSGLFPLFGVGLFIGGYKLDDPVLLAWSFAVGPASFVVLLHDWNQAVAGLVLGLLTVSAGAVARMWEARKMMPRGRRDLAHGSHG